MVGFWNTGFQGPWAKKGGLTAGERHKRACVDALYSAAGASGISGVSGARKVSRNIRDIQQTTLQRRKTLRSSNVVRSAALLNL